MNTFIDLLFNVVIGGLFALFRAGLYWLLAPSGQSFKDAQRTASNQTARVWRRGEPEERVSGREVLIRLTAGILTAGVLLGIGGLLVWYGNDAVTWIENRR